MVDSDIKRALTRALREGLTVEDVRRVVMDHLAGYSADPHAKYRQRY